VHYLLMIYDDEKTFAGMPEAKKTALMQEYRAFTRDIVKSGHFRAGAQLQPTSEGTTVRKRNGRHVITDGPFAETKEHLGGYYPVECKDLDEAIAIAGRIPSIRVGGSIEARPLVPTFEAARTPPAR